MEKIITIILAPPAALYRNLRQLYFHVVEGTSSSFLRAYTVLFLILTLVYLHYFEGGLNSGWNILLATVWALILGNELHRYNQEDERFNENDESLNDTAAMRISEHFLPNIVCSGVFSLMSMISLFRFHADDAVWDMGCATFYFALCIHGKDKGKGKKVFSTLKKKITETRKSPAIQGVRV